MQLRYLHDYIVQGHQKAKAPLSQIQQEALSMLEDFLNNNQLTIEFLLNPGELVIINNKLICHGRTSFRDGPQVRQLIRLWANYHSPNK
jgi:alpha-ketoglutarate-dependent taurine dioxygenase